MSGNVRALTGAPVFKPAPPGRLSNQGRMALLALVMAGLAVTLAVVSFIALYLAAFEEEKKHLETLASTERNLIESVARFDRIHLGISSAEGVAAATINQVDAALRNADITIREDIVLAVRVGDEIHYQTRSRGFGRSLPEPVAFTATADKAMFLALSGETGITRSYGQDQVEYLEAYTHIPSLDGGLIARVPIAEIQKPFFGAGLLTIAGIFGIIIVSIVLFRKISAPLIRGLEKSAQMLAEGQRIAQYGSWYRDLIEEQIEWSDQIYTILGYEPGAFEPNFDVFFEHIHKDDRAHVQKALRLLRQSFDPYFFEYRIVQPDGTIRYIEAQGEISKNASGDAVSISGVMNDVTEHKLAELSIIELNEGLEQRVETRTRALKNAIAEHQQTQELLLDSEARMRAIVDTAADGIISINGEGQISSFNSAAERIFGWSAADVINKNITRLIPKSEASQRASYLTHFRDILEQATIGSICELEGRRKDGSEFPLELAVSVNDMGGRQIYTGIIRDISDRKAFEQELALKEARLREAMDNMPGAMAFIDNDMKIIVASNRYSEICEVPAELLDDGRSFVDHFKCRAERGDYGAGDPDAIVASRVQAFQVPSDDVFELSTPSGRTNGIQRRPAKGGGTVVVITDITELKTKEKELRETFTTLKSAQNSLVQAEKMASLGGLVAGIAHEINTPVGISLTAASHLEDESEQMALKFDAGEMTKSDLRDYVATAGQSTKMISANLKRAADLIGSFKQVAVDQSSEEKRNFRLSPYLEEIIMSLYPQLKKNGHKVSMNCGPELEMDSYPGAFSQIVTNLVMNSLIHGFRDNVTGQIRIEAIEIDSQIQIVYSDDGCGMDDATRGKIFDPFFTTNRSHGGSGLGMNIVYNLVTQSMKGSVTCTSVPGQGTTFTLLFPMQLAS